MSDRWGPSVDCQECGLACSASEVKTCGLCSKTMCKHCLDGDHKCETPETEPCQ